MSVVSWAERVELAQRHSPRLVLFPENQQLGRPKVTGDAGDYHPRTVELLIDHGHLYPGTLRLALRLDFGQMFDYSKRTPASLAGLAASNAKSDQLRLIGPPLPKADEAWSRYFALLANGGTERYPLCTYARVLTRREALDGTRQAGLTVGAQEVGRPFYQPETARDDDLVIQYWFCYYFDDWYNVHEGDWEGASVFLKRDGTTWRAVGATYYAHENGSRRHWADVQRVSNDHPLVFPASGSHASYFQYLKTGHETSISGTFLPLVKLKLKISVSSDRLDFVADERQQPLLEPHVEVLPSPIGPAAPDDPAWRHAQWLKFPGSWGVRELGKIITGGPAGPAFKGLKWHHPFAWSELECWPDYLVY